MWSPSLSLFSFYKPNSSPSLILLSSFYSPILPYSPSLSHPPSSFSSSSRPPSRAQEKRQTEKTHKRLPHVDEDKNDVMRGGLLSKTIDHISVLIEDWFTGTEFPWSHSQPRISLVSFPAQNLPGHIPSPEFPWSHSQPFPPSSFGWWEGLAYAMQNWRGREKSSHNPEEGGHDIIMVTISAL